MAPASLDHHSVALAGPAMCGIRSGGLGKRIPADRQWAQQRILGRNFSGAAAALHNCRPQLNTANPTQKSQRNESFTLFAVVVAVAGEGAGGGAGAVLIQVEVKVLQ